MLAVAPIQDRGIEDKLHDGSAFATFRNMIACHGGDPDAELPTAENQIPLPAPKSGFISKADAEAIGRTSLLLGVGRTKTTDTIDPAAGLSDLKKIGEQVEVGEPLCIIHTNGYEDQAQLFNLLKPAFEISPDPIEPPPLVLEEVK